MLVTGKTRLLKFALLPLCVIAAGCAHKAKPQPGTATASASVLEVGATAPRSGFTPTPDDNYAAQSPYAGKLSGYHPSASAAEAGMQPAVTQSPAPAPEPTYADTATSNAATQYKVRKGDTLFRIAREHYGDGKKWQRIAAANPGLSPSSLKVGQVISVP